MLQEEEDESYSQVSGTNCLGEYSVDRGSKEKIMLYIRPSSWPLAELLQ